MKKLFLLTLVLSGCYDVAERLEQASPSVVVIPFNSAEAILRIEDVDAGVYCYKVQGQATVSCLKK